jgi:hypothetical protein
MVARQRLAVFSCSAVWATVPAVQPLWIGYAWGSLTYVCTMTRNRPMITPTGLLTRSGVTLHFITQGTTAYAGRECSFI